MRNHQSSTGAGLSSLFSGIPAVAICFALLTNASCSESYSKGGERVAVAGVQPHLEDNVMQDGHSKNVVSMRIQVRYSPQDKPLVVWSRIDAIQAEGGNYEIRESVTLVPDVARTKHCVYRFQSGQTGLLYDGTWDLRGFGEEAIDNVKWSDGCAIYTLTYVPVKGVAQGPEDGSLQRQYDGKGARILYAHVFNLHDSVAEDVAVSVRR